MLGRIRTVFANSWVARIMAALLAVAFGAWGIQGALFGGGAGAGADDVATVNGQSVTAVDFESAYQRQLDETARQMARQGGQPPDASALPPPMKQEIGAQVLRQLVTERAIVAHGQVLGLSVPDPVLREAVFAIPQFQGTDGRFDRAKFDQVLAASRLTEPRLLALVHDDLMSRALIEPVRASAVAPALLVGTLFNFIAEERTVQTVTVPFSSVPVPPQPTPEVLQRFFTNHPAAFRAPEYRKIRAVVLSPETVARDVAIPDAEIRAAYDAQKARLYKPGRRSVQVVTVGSQAQANGIADLWRGGAQWASVKALAASDNGTAVSLADAGEREFPSPTLGRAVFAAVEGSITDPIRDDAGWVVLRVIGSKAATGDYDSVKETLREQLAEKRAAGAIQDKVDRLQDAVAGGGLDKIPADIGAVAAEGTLDAKGMTAGDDPAPLPGSEAVRTALIAHAFGEAKGVPATLQQGPGGSYYAVEVESVTPPRARTLTEALPDVLSKWMHEQIRHGAETRAATIYAAASAAHGLGPAAAAAGLPVATPASFRRGSAAPGVPAPLVQVAFGLRQGQATMVETADGFVVAVVTAVVHPPAAAAPEAFGRLTGEVRGAIANDLETGYAAFLVREANPKLNEAVVRRVLGP